MRKLLRVLYAGALIFSALVLVFRLPRGVETDVLALLGESDGALAGISRANAATYRVLAETPEIAAEVRALGNFDEPINPKALYELVRTKGKGLLGPKQTRLLGLNETNKIARATLRRDYTGVGLFPKEDDPNYFLNDFVLDFQSYQPQLNEGEELLIGHSENPAADPALHRLIDYARTHEGVYLSGAPFHTAIATRRSVKEINFLGTVSLLGVVVFGWMLFKSFKFVLPTVLNLGAGFLVGSAALFLLPWRPHVLSFLFGTTLIGLGVDYCYHRLHAANRRTILAALITTSCAFLPLLFAPVRILNEMAVFTLSGLVTIAAGVLLWIKGCAREAEEKPRKFTSRHWVQVLAVLLSAVGLSRASLTNDPSAFNRMDPLLKAGEARMAEVTGMADVKFLPVRLEKWQRHNAELKAKMGEEPKGEFLTAADLPREMTFEQDGETYLILPSEDGYDMKSRLELLFSELTSWTLILLSCAVFLMAAIVLVIFRRKASSYLSPVIVAVLLTAGLLAACGVKFTLFHLIVFFMILGLGIDYAIFGGGRVVFYSFLTSLVGFGMLGFTSFPPTRMMGTTLALGLFFAWSFAGRTGGGHGVTALPKDKWHERKEQAAGKIRLWLTFNLYHYLGKDFCKLCAVFVVACAYPGFRKRCGFKKALSFAFGLLDKLDACTLRKNLPRMTVVGDAGWMKGGCFLLSTHVGTIEVLPVLNPQPSTSDLQPPKVHAFQQLTHNKLFTEMFMRHFDKEQFVLHPVEEIGIETAVEMQDAIRRGEMVLMAGDRDPASGGKKGVFKFAKLMESPVYAITCVRTGWNEYTVNARELNRSALQAEYETFLAEESAKYPNETFNF